MNKNIKFNLGMVWTLGLCIYFIFFGIIIQSTQEVERNSDINDFTSEAFSNTFSTANGGCSYPKVYIKANGAEEIENSARHLSGVSCEFTKGRYNETLCDAIEGCSWVDSVWPISDFCDGDVNRSYYGITTDNIDNDPDVLFAIDGGPVAAFTLGDHINAFTDEVIDYLYYSAYKLTAIRNDETLCDMYAFTWLNSTALYEQDREEQTVWRTFSQFFSFSYDWNTGNSYIDNILTFLTVWLPGIMLLGAIFIFVTPSK